MLVKSLYQQPHFPEYFFFSTLCISLYIRLVSVHKLPFFPPNGACLSTDSVPDSLKQAIVKPLLKKLSLDPNILKTKTNVRPVSNLPFVSKLLEKSFFLNCLYTSNATICGIFFSRRIDRGTAQRQPCFVPLTTF